MRLTMPYAFPTEVQRTTPSGRRASHRYVFEDEATFDVPEFAAGEAPVVVLHAAFRTGYGHRAPDARVAFRRIGGDVYEPISRADGTALVGLEPASVAACTPACAALAARREDTRFLKRGSKVVPDRHKAETALEQVTNAVNDIVLVGGAAYRRSYEPVYVVREGYVTTGPATPYWSEDKAWSRFRLDETDLVRDCLAALGRDPAQVATAMARFEVVDASLLAADLKGQAVDSMLRDCMDALSKHLHARPMAAVAAYAGLRALAYRKDRDADVTSEKARAIRVAVDAFDADLDGRMRPNALAALGAYDRRVDAVDARAALETAFGAVP